VGSQGMNQPAYYAHSGTLLRDLLALLHPPYTAWHLSYVAMGAAIAQSLDWGHLAGTLLAFFFGTGIAAHALDELHDRPLGTRLSRATLLVLTVGAMSAVVTLAIIGALMISPWVLGWALLGVLLATGYPLEIPAWLHTDLGFALSWGGYPVLVGYWAQTRGLSVAALLLAAVATLLSLTQRALSTPARFVRRRTSSASAVLELSTGTETWERVRLLHSWERPLRLLAWGMAALAAALLAIHL